MKVYKEMTISSKNKDITQLPNILEKKCKEPWFYNVINYGEKYINVEYVSEKPCSADIALYNKSETSGYSVVNIVPIDKSELTIDEYNQILDAFNSFLSQIFENDDFEISFSKSEVVSQEELMHKKTLEALNSFSVLANKSTGSSHPSDRRRWYEFILEAFKSEDYEKLLPDVLQNLLIQDYKWPEEKVFDLISEYEFSIGLLQKLEEDM